MNLGPVEILTTIAIVVVLCAALFWGNRPTPERFADANGLVLDDETRTDVAAALSRTYRGRLFGGGASFLVALGLALATNATMSFTRSLAAILTGTLVGIAVAQFAPGPAPGAVRVASLEARDVDDYRPRRAKILIGGALCILLAYSGAFLLTAATGAMVVIVSVVAAAGIGVVLVGEWLQRRIVEHARAGIDDDHARVDDALRGSAVRAVHHAIVGILLCGIAFVGVTGASWGPVRVEVDRHDRFELAPGADDIVTGGGQIWWTDFAGERHTREVPAESGRITGWRRTYESSPVALAGTILALLAGIGALLEWREAGRAWRRPGSPRGAPRHPLAHSTGNAS